MLVLFCIIFGFPKVLTLFTFKLNFSVMDQTQEQPKEIQTTQSIISEEAKLYSVLSHITLGVVGIIVAFNLVAPVKGNKYVYVHAIVSIINGLLMAIMVTIWHLLYLGLSQMMGPQTVFDIYWIGMMLIILVAFGGALYNAIMASVGRFGKLPWIQPIVKKTLTVLRFNP